MEIRSNSCTGLCESCGKCKGANILREMSDRETKLFLMPEDFIADNKEKMGIAFDIGTTTVVGNLWDLKEAKSHQIIGKTNPQNIFGADVISRINYCSDNPENFIKIRGKIIECLNDIIEEFITDNNFDRDDIVSVVVAGNSTMSHIFAGYNPKSLAYAPFSPAYAGEKEFVASEVFLNLNKEAKVILMPNIAGHIGGDIMAGILASRLDKLDGMNLFIDIGTNGEIVLSKDGKMVACSTAAGPAFEGASIYQGMRAETGAIEKIKIKDGTVYFKTIEEGEPVGICGSGVIQAVGEMLKSGIINNTGRLLLPFEMGNIELSEDLKSRLREGGNGREFVLVFKEGKEDIIITQKDVREVQLAKGAVYAGIILLLSEFEEEIQHLDRVIVAGAFGNYIDKESSVAIGLLPDVSLDKIIFIGNAAGAGASMVLLSEEERNRAKDLVNQVMHLELANGEKFQEEYLKALSF